MAIRYHITLKDPEKARGNDYLFSFIAHGADEFAEELEDVLRSDEFFERWRRMQPESEVIDPELASSDPNATVKGEQHDLQIDLIVITTVPESTLKHHMNLLAGSGWELRDVSQAPGSSA